MPRPGVLALQGDFREHMRALRDLGEEAIAVRVVEDLARVDRLVIPGGESTTIGKLLVQAGLLEPIRERAVAGMPVMGTCAGMILMAGSILDGRPGQPSLDLLDIEVRRNAFGRQLDSFERELEVVGLDSPLHAVFIRAPYVERVGAGVEVLAEVEGHPVAIRQGHLLGLSFHPELSGDTRMHRLLLELSPSPVASGG